MTEYGQDDQNSVSDMDRNISLCHHIQTVFEIYQTSHPVYVRNLTGIQQKVNIHIHLVLQLTVLYAFVERRLDMDISRLHKIVCFCILHIAPCFQLHVNVLSLLLAGNMCVKFICK
jgi:hypothetical protein